jgi:hypothetical protein
MLSYKPTGKRSLGRPRKRWISQIWGSATGKSPIHEEEECWCMSLMRAEWGVTT